MDDFPFLVRNINTREPTIDRLSGISLNLLVKLLYGKTVGRCRRTSNQRISRQMIDPAHDVSAKRIVECADVFYQLLDGSLVAVLSSAASVRKTALIIPQTRFIVVRFPIGEQKFKHVSACLAVKHSSVDPPLRFDSGQTCHSHTSLNSAYGAIRRLRKAAAFSGSLCGES